jgi:hypothetical protein
MNDVAKSRSTQASERRRRTSRFHHATEYSGSEAIEQRQTSVNKKSIDPANVQIRPMKEEVDAVAVIDSRYFGVPRPEYSREGLGLATKGAGIITSLVPEAQTSISQVDNKGKTR